jgi:prolyl-tRNA synthetase
VFQILDIYRQAFEDLLAVPVTRGKKTDKEKFAGGLYTTTCEAFIETNGRAIQACTSHCLGQNFSKIFDITYESEGTKTKNLAWQNSWGFTTRSIGIMIMVHGDNRGIVLPPRVAPIQVVIIPIYGKDNKDIINKQCELVHKMLSEAGVRVETDLRNHKSAWKYYDWDLRGVPLRIEIGQHDFDTECVTFCRRDNTDKSKKLQIPLGVVVNQAKETLIDFQRVLFEKASIAKNEHTKQATDWETFLNYLNHKNIVLVPFCCTGNCETDVKARSSTESKAQSSDLQFELTGAAKSLCIPFDQPPLEQGTKCFACESNAFSWTLFGISY